MNPLKDSILEQIKAGSAPQHSAAYFHLKNAGWTVLLLLGVVLGVFAWAMLFHFANATFLLSMVLHSPWTGIKLLLIGLPAIWITLTIAGTFWAAWAGAHTKNGYRWGMVLWLCVLLVPQIAGGFVLEASSVGEQLDARMTEVIPRYRGAAEQRDALWQRPENGFLRGKIETISKDSFTLIDPKETIWTITPLKPVAITPEQRVFLRGRVTADGEFEAKNIRFRPNQPPRPPRPTRR